MDRLGIVAACIAPHGWVLVPLFGAPSDEAVGRSRAALDDLGRRIASAGPETLVVVEPHGLLVEGSVALLDGEEVAGATQGPEGQGASAHGFSLRFAVDRPLLAVLAEEARAAGVPAFRVRNFLEFVPLPIEYGTMVPLWFLGTPIAPAPRLVVATVDRGVPGDACVRLGRAIRTAAERAGRRVAVVASSDLAHTHAGDGPFGYSPAAREADALIVEALRAGRLEGLARLDPDLVRSARVELAPLVVLGGVVEGTDLRGELLSYEVPSYFGMLCAAFAPTEEARDP